jgi:hypothetical protein
MSAFKQAVRKVLPDPLYRFGGRSWDAINRIPQWTSATFHPWRRDSARRLAQLKDIHQGERCFIIGNGPSLQKTDLTRLEDEFTFGMNRFFLAFPELGFQTTYYLTVNDLVVEQSALDIQALKMPRFVSWRSREWLQPEDSLYFLYTTYTGPKFAQQVTGRVWEGATVTYTALQLAYHMGFTKVILIGVDHNYSTKGKPNETVVSQGDDPNHFHPGYFGKGFRWQLPDLATNEVSYGMAKAAYEQDEREVVDATVGGKLQVFRKIKYDDLF